jgi:hypothetical protein
MKTRRPSTTARSALSLAAVLLATSACTMGTRVEEPVKPAVASPADRAAAADAAFVKERVAYSVNAQKTLNDLSGKIAAMRTQVPSDPIERDQHLTSMARLEDQLAKARDDVAALKDATPQSWADRRRAVDQSILAVQSSYDVAHARLSH